MLLILKLVDRDLTEQQRVLLLGSARIAGLKFDTVVEAPGGLRLTNLLKRSAKATIWMLAGQWIARLFGLASTIVLARLLKPADFGVFAVAASYLALVQGLSTFNAGQALIKLRDEHRSVLDTAWTLNVARGLALALLVIASSSIAARFVGDSRVSTVIQVIGLLPAIAGSSNPKFVTFEKQIDFSRLALIEVVTKALAVVSMIAAALLLRSYWALVTGAFVATTAKAAMSYGMKPYWPRFCLTHAKRIFAFTGWLSLANALNTISSTLDNLIVARFLGVRDAGVYNMTRQVAALPNDGFLAPLERVLFASFSEIAHDAGRLASRVLEVVGILASIAVPFTVGLALTAPEFVPLVLGEQWIACIPLLQIILPFFAISMIVTSATPAAMAAGATHHVFRTALYFGVLRLPTFVAGVAFYGLVGAMYALALVSIVWWICNFHLLRKVVSISLRQLAIAVHRQLISAAAMAGAMASASVILDVTSPSWLLLCGKVALGTITYTAVHAMLWRLEGQPPGIETRIYQLLRGWRGVPLAKT